MGSLKHVARSLNLPFGDRTMTYNSRLAQELGKWAEREGRGEDFHEAAFRAYFAEGKNIAKTGVLVDLARALGLSGKAAQKVIEERSFREVVDSDWSLSRSAGITAVPTFMMSGDAVVGAQPYEILEQLMDNSGVPRR